MIQPPEPIQIDIVDRQPDLQRGDLVVLAGSQPQDEARIKPAVGAVRPASVRHPERSEGSRPGRRFFGRCAPSE
jgi:hypothetical protein